MPMVREYHRCRIGFSGAPGDIWQCPECKLLWKYSGWWQQWQVVWFQKTLKRQLGLEE